MPGEDLVFPAGASNLSAVNDFSAGTSFGSITIGAPKYALSGNAVNLTGILSTSYSSGTSSSVIDTDLGAGIVQVVSGGELDLYGVISARCARPGRREARPQGDEHLLRHDDHHGERDDALGRRHQRRRAGQ
jgi:hypothetical protein